MKADAPKNKCAKDQPGTKKSAMLERNQEKPDPGGTDACERVFGCPQRLIWRRREDGGRAAINSGGGSAARGAL